MELEKRIAEMDSVAFRDDELAHREIAIAQGAADTLGYELITGAIQAGSRLAIWLSTRL